jgi:hypothetical protein
MRNRYEQIRPLAPDKRCPAVVGSVLFPKANRSQKQYLDAFPDLLILDQQIIQ